MSSGAGTIAPGARTAHVLQCEHLEGLYDDRHQERTMTTNLRITPPRVFSRVASPKYPRVFGLGALLLAGACSRSPTELLGTSQDAGIGKDPKDIPVAPAGTPGPIMADPAPVADAGVVDGSAAQQQPPPACPGGAKAVPFEAGR